MCVPRRKNFSILSWSLRIHQQQPVPIIQHLCSNRLLIGLDFKLSSKAMLHNPVALKQQPSSASHVSVSSQISDNRHLNRSAIYGTFFVFHRFFFALVRLFVCSLIFCLFLVSLLVHVFVCLFVSLFFLSVCLFFLCSLVGWFVCFVSCLCCFVFVSCACVFVRLFLSIYQLFLI